MILGQVGDDIAAHLRRSDHRDEAIAFAPSNSGETRDVQSPVATQVHRTRRFDRKIFSWRVVGELAVLKTANEDAGRHPNRAGLILRDGTDEGVGESVFSGVGGELAVTIKRQPA